MMEHVEFTEQAALGPDRRRPDLIVTLPGDKRIVVDAKTPMDAFETEDVHRQQAHFRRHAETLTTRAKELAQRDYTGGVPGAFDFAVMFVPHDAILDAAERAKAGVWDQAWRQHRVLIATPGLLIALLRTIAIGWQQAKVQENAKAIADAAGELYARPRVRRARRQRGQGAAAGGRILQPQCRFARIARPGSGTPARRPRRGRRRTDRRSRPGRTGRAARGDARTPARRR